MESNISKNSFLSNFRMAPLPALCSKFVELVGILVSESHFFLSMILILDCSWEWILSMLESVQAPYYRPAYDYKPSWLPVSVGNHVVNLFQDSLFLNTLLTDVLIWKSKKKKRRLRISLDGSDNTCEMLMLSEKLNNYV